MVQDVALRVKKAMDAFFRRLKAGETARLSALSRQGTLRFADVSAVGQGGRALSASGKRLLLSKVGDVKIIIHRPLEGTPKTATIRRTATGKWYVTICCEWDPMPLPATGQQVGIDVGLATFATLVRRRDIANPRFFRRGGAGVGAERSAASTGPGCPQSHRAGVTERVTQAHPELDETDLWQAVSQDAEERAAWNQRQKRRKVVARTHERARWKREDFAHQHSRRIVNEFDLIAVEDLSVASMVQNGRLAKSIHDAAWSQFAALIACKAAWADRRYIAVNPAHTSQDCSGCGNRKTDLTLADRVYRCVACGLVIDRDLNASRNILAVGRHCLGLAP